MLNTRIAKLENAFFLQQAQNNTYSFLRITYLFHNKYVISWFDLLKISWQYKHKSVHFKWVDENKPPFGKDGLWLLPSVLYRGY
jgi:hypothetical protein